jgi:hypothetical protein
MRVCPEKGGHSIGAARIAVDSVDTLAFGLRGGDVFCLVRGGLAPARREGALMEIGSSPGLPSGNLHLIWARLEPIGWVTSRWEEMDPSAGR